MKKVMLVVPPKGKYFGLEKFPPIGLGYLTTALRRHDYDVSIVDRVRDTQITDSAFSNIVRSQKPDVVGFTTWSLGLAEVQKGLRLTKEVDPNIVTMIGGPHPSALPVESLELLKDADYGIQGEAEVGLPQLLNNLWGGETKPFPEIPGLIWREDGKVFHNSPVYYSDLEELGMPAWDLIPPESYAGHGNMIGEGAAPFITSRGCPFHCSFCSVWIIAGYKFRRRPFEVTMDELMYLYKNHGTRHFVVYDEVFTMHAGFVEEFCNAILERGLKVKFTLPNGIRLDSISRELLLLMKKAGFDARVAVGIESGSDRILKIMKKKLTKDEIRAQVDLLYQCGYRPIGYFILGYPTETREEMMETIQFACSLRLYRAAFSCLLPLPGTEVYHIIEENGELPANFDFTLLSTDKVTYAPQGMTREELDKIRRYAHLRFNLRPRILYDYMRDYDSFRFALSKFLSIFVLRDNVPALYKP
ncbi:MAG: B12-binding domain-containing radical SAM protein [Acidobacteria bacterium]|nr:B12-binding domain-containing radical SAM protein [Acidobacteriota bacterium]